MTTLLIRNGTVITWGPPHRVLPRHNVLIKGDTVLKISPYSQAGSAKADTVLDATGKVVLPGFVNAHTHFYSAFARGLAGGKPAKTFKEKLENLWWRLDRALTPEDCYYSAWVTLIDAIRHGTTTLIDHHSSPNAIRGSLVQLSKAVDESGLRACLCYEVTDRNGPEGAEEGIRENAEFLKHVASSKSDRIAGLFGLHASFTLSDATLKKAGEAVAKYETGVHIHVAEAVTDQEDCQKKYGLRIVERLKNFGLLGPRAVCAHGVHLYEHEMDLLARADAAVVHNPQSNLNNAVGTANVPLMMKKGVLVGLGTDAMTENMLEELRSALWARHLADQDAGSGLPEVTKALLQNNPAIVQRIFGCPVGAVREGFKADLILLDYDPPTPLTDETVLGHLLYGLSQVPVDTTIAGGRILMQDRKLAGIDEARILARARELAEKLGTRTN